MSNESHLSSFVLNDIARVHRFCAVCGVHVYIEPLSGSSSGTKEEEDGNKAEQMMDKVLNVRCLNGVEWDALKGLVKKV